MALTELQIRQAKAGEKTYSLSDGRGLILEVRPGGKKYWIVRYWQEGKERRKSLGPYPATGLKDARNLNFELRRKLAQGEQLDAGPSGGDTFRAVAEEWMKIRVRGTLSPGYARVIALRLEKYIYPDIGDMPLKNITSLVALNLCRKIEAQGIYETTRRVRQIISQVFCFGIATGRVETDPTVALRGALIPGKARHHSAILGEKGIRDLMARIDAYTSPLTRLALKFSALVFCRPGEIRTAEWPEIDWERLEWKIPEEKMKAKRPHIVPLATQTIALLKELRRLTGWQKWLFPSSRNDGRSMSENTVRVALRTMGYGNDDMTAHGFRAMASTTLNENGWEVDVIERQLAHAERSSVRAAYNHAEYLPRRREMMQWWADFLCGEQL